MGRTLHSGLWSSALLSLCLGACVSVQGKDFTTKYGRACTITPAPFTPGPDPTPGAKAARARWVSQLDDQSQEVLRCYMQALANVPRMQGRVVVRTTLNAQGGIDDMHVIDNSTNYDAFACCLVSVVRQFNWPPSAAGASVTFDYPFTFRLVDLDWYARNTLEGEWSNTEVRPEGLTLSLDGKMYGDPGES